MEKFFLKDLINNDKYRTIFISAALFLTFDLGVLVPNFLISSQLKRDATSINLAGRQRMLSQRMTKALLQVERSRSNPSQLTQTQQELKKAVNLFDETLNAFSTGGSVTGGDGNTVSLNPVETEKAKQLVIQAQEIWSPYKTKIQPLIDNQANITDADISRAVNYAIENNLKLLDLMNQLTSEQERVADSKAGILQLIQTAGVILALTNFLILLTHSLRKLSDRDLALEKANKEIIALNQRLENENIRMSAELDITHQLQQMMLPKEKELAEIPGLDIAGYMKPADEIGGDYYDVLHHESGVKIGIGDVTGHGLESGVLMIMAQTAVRTLLESKVTDPKLFLSVLNRTIYGSVQRMQSDKNMTLSLIDYKDGHLNLSGQHEDIVIIRQNGEVERIDTVDLGFPLGLEADISTFINSVDIALNPGDIVVLYTDGITEAEDKNGVHYGLDRLIRVVQENSRRSAKQIRHEVIQDIRSYVTTNKMLDDITIVILKQKPIYQKPTVEPSSVAVNAC